MEQIGMIGISGNPATRDSSHNGGWTLALLDITKHRFGNVEIVKDGTEIHAYDKIIINEGINYKEGKFNFFGGVSDDTVQKLTELTKYEGQCYSYNEKIDWSPLAKRKEIRDSSNLLDMIDNLPEVQVLHTDLGSKLIIGDSHSLSIYKPGSSINRIDGKTLHGFLKDPMKYIGDYLRLDDITMYFGNIDVRFHIYRQDNPKQAINKLVYDYTELCSDLIKLGLNVTVQGLLPIEDESRKLPGTGLYLGEKFFGSQSVRQGAVDYFNEAMYDNSKLFGFDYDDAWLPPPLSFDAMEAKQSVHVRPKFYKHADKIQFLLPSSKTPPSLFS